MNCKSINGEDEKQQEKIILSKEEQIYQATDERKQQPLFTLRPLKEGGSEEGTACSEEGTKVRFKKSDMLIKLITFRSLRQTEEGSL